MSDLRTRIIRLAHAKPGLRKHLLPLLSKTAGGGALDRVYNIRVDELELLEQFYEQFKVKTGFVKSVADVAKEFEMQVLHFQAAKDAFEDFKISFANAFGKANSTLIDKHGDWMQPADVDFVFKMMDKIQKIKDS